MIMHDDASLLTRYAHQRDPEAFAILVERHAGLVYGTCLRQCGDRSLAEDASQECFLALATHAAEIRQSLTAWLHTVAMHAASRLGRARREQALPTVDSSVVATDVHAAWRELEPHLDRALCELPEEVRSAVMLRFLDGLTQQQVAQTLGLSQATVSRRIASGITQLRQRLAQQWDEQALGAALGLATVSVSPALLAHATKIGLAGIGAPAAAAAPLATMTGTAVILAGMLTVAASLTLGVGLHHWQGGTPPAAGVPVLVSASPVPVPASPVVARAPAAAAAAATGFLALPITGYVHLWPLDRVIDLIDDQLPAQNGVRLELMPVSDYPLVDLRCDALPLQGALDQVVAASGWRWRSDGTVVTVDRPLPAQTLRDLLQRAGSTDVRNHAAAAQALTLSGDLDACAALLGLLSGSQLDTLAQSDASTAENWQREVIEALARVGGSWQTFVPRGNPLGYLATSPSAQQGVLRSWQRSRRLGWPITNFQCYLAGELRVTDLGPQLLELIHDPRPFLSGLGSTGPCALATTQRLREWGEHALGRMGYQRAEAVLAERLTTAELPEVASLTTALGELQDPAALPRLQAQTTHPWSWFWGVTDFVATDRLCQALQPSSDRPLATLLATSVPVQWGLGDSFICFPSVLELPAMCSTPGAAMWWVRHGFWQGTGRLPSGVVREVVARQRRTAAAADAMLDDALLARDGDDAALERVVLASVGSTAVGAVGTSDTLAVGDSSALINEPTLDIASALASRLSPTRGDALVKRVLAQLDGRPWTVPALSLLSATHPPGVSQRLMTDYPRASPDVRSAMLRYLAADRTVAGRGFILAQARIPAEALRVAEALREAQLEDPVLRAGIIALPVDAWSVARVSHDLELFPESVIPIQTLLRTADVAAITPQLLSHWCEPLIVRTVHVAPEQPWQDMVAQWLAATHDPAVRAACCAWLGSHLSCDQRSLRRTLLTTVIACLATEKDLTAAKAERQLLTDFLTELSDPGDGSCAFYHEDIQMSGGWDDLASITIMDQQIMPALRAALAPPAAKGVKTPANF